MTVTRHFALVPRDGLFCKDGRGWHTSASGRAHGLEWPWPSTVLGAVRTAWGREEERARGSPFNADEWRARTASMRLGRTVALRRRPGAGWTTEHRVWPVPADAIWLEEETQVHRLDPVPPDIPTLGRDDDEARESLWWPRVEGLKKPLAGPRWWSDAEFCTWLAGRSVQAGGQLGHLALSRRMQTHVGIRDADLTAEEGALFSHDVLETLETEAEWAIGVEADVPERLDPEFVTLGSDSRLAKIEDIPSEVFDPSPVVMGAFRSGTAGLRLVVVTPACFQNGWLPDGLERRERTYRGRLTGVSGEVVLRAAFVSRPVHVSGWDMAANSGRGAPKPTFRMVPAGSVYFFQRADDRPFGEAEARSLWLAAIGDRREEGFGRVVPGAWSPRGGNR